MPKVIKNALYFPQKLDIKGDRLNFNDIKRIIHSS